MLEVGTNTVGQWTRCRTVPDGLVMDDICKTLNCTVEDLYPSQKE